MEVDDPKEEGKRTDRSIKGEKRREGDLLSRIIIRGEGNSTKKPPRVI